MLYGTIVTDINLSTYKKAYHATGTVGVCKCHYSVRLHIKE